MIVVSRSLSLVIRYSCTVLPALPNIIGVAFATRDFAAAAATSARRSRWASAFSLGAQNGYPRHAIKGSWYQGQGCRSTDSSTQGLHLCQPSGAHPCGSRPTRAPAAQLAKVMFEGTQQHRKKLKLPEINARGIAIKEEVRCQARCCCCSTTVAATAANAAGAAAVTSATGAVAAAHGRRRR